MKARVNETENEPEVNETEPESKVNETQPGTILHHQMMMTAKFNDEMCEL